MLGTIEELLEELERIDLEELDWPELLELMRRVHRFQDKAMKAAELLDIEE